MTFRLRRIQSLVLLFTGMAAAIAQSCSLTVPSGIVIGGLAGWLDFFVIKELASMVLARKTSRNHLASMAFGKSLLLVVVPASALLLPASVVNGVSFAIGVTMLPAAIVVDACLRAPELQTGDI